MKRFMTVAVLFIVALSAYSCSLKTCAPPPPPGGYSYDWVIERGDQEDRK